jgi:hypothetical protein
VILVWRPADQEVAAALALPDEDDPELDDAGDEPEPELEDESDEEEEDEDEEDAADGDDSVFLVAESLDFSALTPPERESLR